MNAINQFCTACGQTHTLDQIAEHSSYPASGGWVCPSCSAPALSILVVTRHLGLFQFLREECSLPAWAEVVSHVSPEEVQGKHVIGVLPHHLSSAASQYTEIPLILHPEMRGKELSAEEVKKAAQPPRTYIVEVV